MGEKVVRRSAVHGREGPGRGGRPIERTTVFINPITLTTFFCCPRCSSDQSNKPYRNL